MSEHVIELDGQRLRLRNLEKVLYPQVGFTKAEVIDYYARIAPVMLPHVAGRGITLKRFPDGVEGGSFFEKRCPSHRPDFVGTIDGPGDRGGDVRSCRPECGGECREHAPDKAKLRWHTERTVRGASNARTHANGARHTDTVVERERSCLVAHDVSGVATWRGVRTRYRRRSSWTSDGQACHADPSGCHSPEPRAAGLPSGRRPLYEYRIVPAFAQARSNARSRARP